MEFKPLPELFVAGKTGAGEEAGVPDPEYWPLSVLRDRLRLGENPLPGGFDAQPVCWTPLADWFELKLAGCTLLEPAF